MSNPNKTRSFYVASRASLPARPAMWREYRDRGDMNIISSWIDEAGPGETASMFELWARIQREVKQADALLMYAEPGDVPFKGALVEVGMALAYGKPVGLVLAKMDFSRENAERVFGSWVWHPGVALFRSVEEAHAGLRPGSGGYTV